MTKVLLLALFGAVGTLLRVTFASAAQARLGSSFPWGTFGVNLLGSLLFGVVWAATANRGAAALDWRFYSLAGFMGAFTTFSTLMFDVASLVSSGRAGLAVLNLLAQNLLGLGALVLGLTLGQRL